MKSEETKIADDIKETLDLIVERREHASNMMNALIQADISCHIALGDQRISEAEREVANILHGITAEELNFTVQLRDMLDMAITGVTAIHTEALEAATEKEDSNENA